LCRKCERSSGRCENHPHKVGYRRILRPARFVAIKARPEGEKEATPAGEWIAMLALIEGHPNVDVIIFYVLASALLTLILYRHHRKTS
jgi:hypothetical protein